MPVRQDTYRRRHYEAHGGANLSVCLLRVRDGVRELSRSVLNIFMNAQRGLASTLLAILIQSRGLEYRNTVRFSEPASSEQVTPNSTVELNMLRRCEGQTFIFHERPLTTEITPHPCTCFLVVG